MKRKYYYVHYYDNFANVYKIYWSYEKLDNSSIERITRREAIHLCSAERWRRKTDSAFGGYASATIMPYGYDNDIQNDNRYQLNGCIWEER